MTTEIKIDADLEESLGLIPGLMSEEYILARASAIAELESGFNLDARTKPGHHWVKNPKVKGGGFWRKDRPGSKGKSSRSNTKSKNKFTKEIFTAAAIAASTAAVKELSNRNAANNPPVVSKTENNKSKIPVTAILAGATAGSVTTALVVGGERDRAVKEAFEKGNENLSNTIAKHNQELETKTQQARARETELNNQITQLQKEVSQTQEADNLSQQRESEAQLRIETLEKAKQAGEKRIQEQESEINQQKTQLAEQERSIAQLDNELQSKTERERDSKNKVIELEGKINELERTQTESTEQVENLNKELSQAKVQRDRFQDELNSSQQALQAANQELDVKKKDLTTLEAANQQTRSMIEAANNEQANLRSSLENINQELGTTKTQLATASQEIEQKQQQIANLEQSRNAAITSEINRVTEELNQQRDRDIDLINKKATENLAQVLEEKQKQFTAQLNEKQEALDLEIAKGSDPKPLKGQRQSRGDLIATDEGGISLGASARWGSEFFNLEQSTQQQKLANKVDKLMIKKYQDRLLGIERDFAQTIKSSLSTEKSPSKRILQNSQIANTTDKKLIKQLTGREKVLLPGIVQIEKAVATHNVREEVLGIAEERIRDRAKAEYANLLTEFHEQGAVNPQTLAAFDRRSKQIMKKADKQFASTINQLISPKFTKNMESLVSNYLEELPTENIVRRKNRNVSVQLSEEIIKNILGDNLDSIAYRIGKKKALLKLGLLS